MILRRAAKLAALTTITAILSLVVTGTSPAYANLITYSAEQTIPVPPASSYQGAGGGDGWAVALTSDAVYNVFHHSGSLQVACHLQATAEPCGPTQVVTNEFGSGFSTANHVGLWMDQGTKKFYVYATRNSDATAGVVCVDTKSLSANPFCGFTALGAPGETQSQALGSAVLVADKWYSFNYFPGRPVTGASNKLLCFDTKTKAACPSQPLSISLGEAATVTGNSISGIPANIGDRLIVPVALDSGAVLACFDPFSASHACTGSWPALAPPGYVGNNGAPFPLLAPTGAISGLCVPISLPTCFAQDGTSLAAPSGMSGVVTGSSPYNGEAFVTGSRAYVPNGNSNRVECFNYATNSACSGFPKTFQNLGYLYTVNADPARPACLWVNADYGSGQIQNFDAYSGGACGEGPIRVLASQMVVDSPACIPTSYQSLAVVEPDRTAYSSGTVDFANGDAASIPGINSVPLDGNGSASLSGLALNTASGLPQFLITLNDPIGAPGSVRVRLTWSGDDFAACEPGTGGGSSGSFVAMGDSFSAGEGNMPYLPGSDTGLNSCHRSDLAYGPLLSQLHWSRPTYPNFVACSGAITDDLYNPNRETNLIPDPTTGHYKLEPAQMSALTNETRLVTLTIGGNDIGFAEALAKCLVESGKPNPKCQNTGLAKSIANRISALKGIGVGKTSAGYLIHSWSSIIRNIHSKAPNARILIAGYPVLVDPNGMTKSKDGQNYCVVGKLELIGLELIKKDVAVYKDAASWMKAKVEDVNAGIQQAVLNSGVAQAQYIDVASRFAGHALCSSDPWIYPVSGKVGWEGGNITTPYPWSGSFHPTGAGQRSYELAFAVALG